MRVRLSVVKEPLPSIVPSLSQDTTVDSGRGKSTVERHVGSLGRIRSGD
jgi:hypothetical protein